MSLPAYVPAALAASLAGPEARAVMNLEPVAGIAARNETSPTGKSAVVLG